MGCQPGAVFWTSAATPECAVLSRVLRAGAPVHLVYGGPTPGQAADVGPRVAATLERHGFAVEVRHRPDAAMVCVSGRLPAAPG